MKHSVTIATCCYDRDWRIILEPQYLSKQFAKFRYAFAEKILIINTDKDREDITAAAKALCRSGDIDHFYFATDFKDVFRETYQLSDFLYPHRLFPLANMHQNRFLSLLKNLYHFYIKKKGNYRFVSPTEKIFDCSAYALGPLCALYNSTSDYLLYFTEDCSIEEEGDEWIDSGIEALEQHSDYIAVRPTDDDLDERYRTVFHYLDRFWIGYMFTDRMFLTNINTMSHIDFNAAPTGNYPPYGGAGFEAKVFYYMKKAKLKILIHPHRKYVHEHKDYMEKLPLK